MSVMDVIKQFDFFLVETECPGYVRRDPLKSPRWKELLEREANKTLSDMFPRDNNPKACHYVDEEMREEAKVADADEEGRWGTDDELLAAKVLISCKGLNPAARMHPWSKKISDKVMAQAAAELKEDIKSRLRKLTALKDQPHKK